MWYGDDYAVGGRNKHGGYVWLGRCMGSEADGVGSSSAGCGMMIYRGDIAYTAAYTPIVKSTCSRDVDLSSGVVLITKLTYRFQYWKQWNPPKNSILSNATHGYLHLTLSTLQQTPKYNVPPQQAILNSVRSQ